jgi:hypothetical protein
VRVWLLFAFACTSRSPSPNGEGDADTDADSDSDTDSDTDADTDTDIPTGWRWGAEVTVDDAQASLIGELPGDRAGSYLSNVGDVDGDGIDDLSIGADGSDTYADGGGKVYLLYGREKNWSIGAPLAGTPSVAGSVEDERLALTQPLGDVDGDGLADVGIMRGGSGDADEFLMLGSPAPWDADVPVTDADVIAHATDVGDDDVYQEWAVGDFDGDSLDDWLLTFRTIGGGTAWVLSGAALAGTVEFPGSAVALHVYGGSLATSSTPVDYEPLGDFTGDGFADVGVEDPQSGYHVVAGWKSPIENESVVDASVASIASADGGGVFVDSIGDVNGDGFGDLWAISRDDRKAGLALFGGGPGNEGELRPDDATAVLAPGWNVFGLYDVGDLNGDGLHDLASFVESSEAIWDLAIVLGRSVWPAIIDRDDVDGWIPGIEAGALADLEGPLSGDLDGDGMNELLLAAPDESWDAIGSAGTVRVFRGRKNWPPEIDRNDFDLMFHGDQTNQALGTRSRFVVADVDGDGTDDVVSSSYYHPTADGTGTVFVFFGPPAP